MTWANIGPTVERYKTKACDRPIVTRGHCCKTNISPGATGANARAKGQLAP